MKFIFIKLFIGLVLFGTLVALTFTNIPNAGRLLDFCYGALMGLGVMHLGSGSQEGVGVASPASKEAGFASPLAMMLIAGMGLALSACATTTTQQAQMAYVQSCATYNAALGAAVTMRQAGKLNDVQIKQISLIESQVTPICTGSLPVNPQSATTQITAAVTSLAILEAINKE